MGNGEGDGEGDGDLVSFHQFDVNDGLPLHMHSSAPIAMMPTLTPVTTGLQTSAPLFC